MYHIHLPTAKHEAELCDRGCQIMVELPNGSPLVREELPLAPINELRKIHS